VAFRNAKNIIRNSSPFNSYKLLLVTAMNTRPQYRALWRTLLRPFIHKGQVSFRYRCYQRNLKANLRMSEIMSDVLSVWELCVADTYEVDLGFSPDLVIDCGGNMGFFTMRMAAAASSVGNTESKFIVIEPLPENVELIQKHLQMNGINAEIKPVCLGGSRRSIPFYCREAIRSSFDPHEPFTKVVDMPVITLEDAIGSSPAKRILIKLDIEGMELEALTAFVPTERRAVYLFGELHNYAGESSQMESLFRDNGWTFSFSEMADNYAQFKACSPAALPYLRSMRNPEPEQSGSQHYSTRQGAVGTGAPIKL
jgi:FkbM family methyltransferase